MQTIIIDTPIHFLSALFNSDESGLELEDVQALDAFLHEMMNEYEHCFAIGVDGECEENDYYVEPSFMGWHDWTRFGVLACDCVPVIFDIGPSKNVGGEFPIAD